MNDQSALSQPQHSPILNDTVIELLPAAVYVCDAQGLIVRFNRKAAELWGRSPRLGETDERYCGAYRLYRPDGSHLPHDQTPMADALHRGIAARDMEVWIERPDLSRICALVNIEPLRAADGQIIGAINCFQDITTRKEAEARLQESEALLRTIFDTTPECIKLVRRDGSIMRMNRSGQRMVEADDPMQIESADMLQVIAPEHRGRWREEHEKVCAGEFRSWEFELLGRKGMRRHMETHAAPLRMPDGEIVQLAVSRDITDRKRNEDALLQSEQRLREILEALPTAVYTTDAKGRITFYNRAATDLWGVTPELGTAEWCGSWRLFLPDGTPLPHDQCPMAVALKTGKPVREQEAIAERPDGSRVSFMPYPTPLFDASGQLAGAVNILIDISFKKRAEQRLQLMIDELNHRVKNTLATVQSLARQTARGAGTQQEFNAQFQSRLMTLSNAHGLLTTTDWRGANMHAVVRQQLDHHGGDGGRTRISGEDVLLKPRCALTLAMVLHELATNAAKYGALSVTGGSVAVEWAVPARKADPAAALVITWRESGGPKVVPPTRTGFGTRLIKAGIGTELKGKAELNYDPDGFRCTLRIPYRYASNEALA